MIKSLKIFNQKNLFIRCNPYHYVTHFSENELTVNHFHMSYNEDIIDIKNIYS